MVLQNILFWGLATFSCTHWTVPALAVRVHFKYLFNDHPSPFVPLLVLRLENSPPTDTFHKEKSVVFFLFTLGCIYALITLLVSV